LGSVVKSIPWDGQRISKPGVYAHLPLDDYHRGDICDGPSLSSTHLRILWQKSPEHFWDQSPLNPAAEPRAETEDFILGRAVHHLICGEAGFANHFVVRPATAPDGRAWNGNNKTCKDWLAEQRKLRKHVLVPDNIAQIRGMAIKISSHPDAPHMLNGLVERSIFWRDNETGVWLKARPDIIPTASGDFVDLKTTRSVMHVDLVLSLGTFGYVQQGALVLEGARALDLEAATFSLVWAEKTRPYSVRTSTLIDDDLMRGTRMNRVAIRTFKTCFESKSWPGPGDDRDIEYLQLSERERERIDERLKLHLAETV
jgi:PDDEXK-like domain of unknown function (DUF3799)